MWWPMSPEAASPSAKPLLRDVAAGLPAVSGLALAALYGLGVMTSVTQLLGAHLPVQDALPLIPLQEHLTKGLAAVFTSLPLLVLFVLAFLTVLYLYGISRSSQRHAQTIDSSLPAAKALLESLGRNDPNAAAEALRAEKEAADAEARAIRAEVADVQDSPNDDARASLDEKVAKFLQRGEERRQRLQAMTADLDARPGQLAAVENLTRRMEEATSALSRSQRWQDLFERHHTRFFRIFGAVLIIGAVLLPPVYAVGYLALGLLYGVAAPKLFRHGQTVVWYALLGLVTAGPWVANYYVNPPVLPKATVVTKTGVVRGSLITFNGDRYVLSARRGSFQSLPAAEVRSVTVQGQKRPKQESVLDLLF